MPDEPGRRICDGLQLLRQEIAQSKPSNQKDLKAAIEKLMKFRGCDRMRP